MILHKELWDCNECIKQFFLPILISYWTLQENKYCRENTLLKLFVSLICSRSMMILTWCHHNSDACLVVLIHLNHELHTASEEFRAKHIHSWILIGIHPNAKKAGKRAWQYYIKTSPMMFIGCRLLEVIWTFLALALTLHEKWLLSRT